MDTVVELAAWAMAAVVVLGVWHAIRWTREDDPDFASTASGQEPGSAGPMAAALGVQGDEFRHWGFGMSEDFAEPGFNPASGLLILGGMDGFDTAGDMYGFDSSAAGVNPATGYSMFSGAGWFDTMDHWTDFDTLAPTINPATGLPMMGSVDTAGNLFGCNSSTLFSEPWPSDTLSCNPASGFSDVGGGSQASFSNDSWSPSEHDAGTGMSEWSSSSFDSW